MKYFTLFLISFCTFAQHDIVENYSIFKDRSLIENRLHQNMYESYIESELNLTSQSYSLSDELSEIVEGSSSQSEKEQKVQSLLQDNKNSLNYVDLNSSVAIPFPTFKVKKYFISPSIFYNLDLSSYFAISNFNGSSDLTTKVYMGKETRVGVSTILTKEYNKESLLKMNLYYFKKSDVLINQTVSDLISNKKIYDFGTLNQGESSFTIDLLWKTINLHRTIKIEAFDLKLFEVSKDRDLVSKNTPLLHAFYQTHNVTLRKFWFEYYVGAHYRKSYSFLDGIYVGAWLKLLDSPFKSSLTLTKTFLSLTPEYRRKSFFVNYKFKWTHAGKIDGFDSPIIHSLNTGLTF